MAYCAAKEAANHAAATMAMSAASAKHSGVYTRLSSRANRVPRTRLNSPTSRKSPTPRAASTTATPHAPMRVSAGELRAPRGGITTAAWRGVSLALVALDSQLAGVRSANVAIGAPHELG